MKLQKIILIDNSDIDNFVNSTLIRSSGLAEEMALFQSAAEGLSYLRQVADKPREIPDLILLDLGMQLMDGFGFMEEFAKLPDSVRNFTKIIVLTSSIDPNDKLRSRAHPFVIDLIEKPLKLDTLKVLWGKVNSRESN